MAEYREDEIQWECACAHFFRRIPGIGNKSMRQIKEHYGTCAAAYKAVSKNGSDGYLDCILNERVKETLKVMRKTTAAEKEYHRLLASGIRCIPQNHGDYPEKLLYIPDAPEVLYVKGSMPRQEEVTVAIVGARNCSPYGKTVAEELGRKLSLSGVGVVSGMAKGVDGISQRSALNAGGKTYGVLGCGADVCYPTENRDIYEKMANGLNGSGIISEYVPGTMPEAGLFPPRNRIISGMADVLVVIEARQKSGTFITVTNALDQGKDVYAVPGRLGDGLSYGCNRLISQGAGILYDTDNFLQILRDEYGMAGGEVLCEKKQKNDVMLTGEEKTLWNVLDISYLGVEELLRRTEGEIPVQRMLSLLATMECRGIVESEGGFYRKNP